MACDISRYAAVAVKERVNPREPVMRRRGGEYGFGLTESAVDLFKPAQEARHCAATDGDMRADRNIAVA